MDAEVTEPGLQPLASALQSLVLEFLDASALARAEESCKLLQLCCRSGELWRLLVLRLWGWIVQLTPPKQSWKQFAGRLSSPEFYRFCIVGGTPPGAGPDGQGLAYAFNPVHMSPREGWWSRLPLTASERNMPAIVRDVTGALVVMGGLDLVSARALRTCERFHVEDNKWLAFPSMRIERCCCSATTDARGRVFVVGGGEHMYRGSQAWDSIEMYEADLHDTTRWCCGAWRDGPSMLEARCALGVAYSQAADRIVAVGGYGGHGRYLDTAEWLCLSNGSSNMWESLPRMSCRRAGPNAAVGPDQRIYVIGGGPDGRAQYDTMEVLDPREPRWQVSRATLRVGRHYNAAAFGPDGRLYVAGAFRHEGQLDVVERYDPRLDSWEDLPSVGGPVQFSAGAFIW